MRENSIEISPEIKEAAMLIEHYFQENGIENWQYLGLADRKLVVKMVEMIAIMKKKGDSAINSDSVIGSCNCLTKSPDFAHHKAGCKYRLIMERDRFRLQVAQIRLAMHPHMNEFINKPQQG